MKRLSLAAAAIIASCALAVAAQQCTDCLTAREGISNGYERIAELNQEIMAREQRILGLERDLAKITARMSVMWQTPPSERDSTWQMNWGNLTEEYGNNTLAQDIMNSLIDSCYDQGDATNREISDLYWQINECSVCNH